MEALAVSRSLMSCLVIPDSPEGGLYVVPRITRARHCKEGFVGFYVGELALQNLDCPDMTREYSPSLPQSRSREV